MCPIQVKVRLWTLQAVGVGHIVSEGDMEELVTSATAHQEEAFSRLVGVANISERRDVVPSK
jgi:hypothetical protein